MTYQLHDTQFELGFVKTNIVQTSVTQTSISVQVNTLAAPRLTLVWTLLVSNLSVSVSVVLTGKMS